MAISIQNPCCSFCNKHFQTAQAAQFLRIKNNLVIVAIFHLRRSIVLGMVGSTETSDESAIMTADAIVLGAGIIGVSTALQLARKGKRVVLVDRREPGEETSFGNAGLIQREGVVPYG